MVFEGKDNISFSYRIKYSEYENKLIKFEAEMKYYVLQLLYDKKISLELYELLSNGMLVWDYKKRWNCEKVYNHKWFNDLR